MAGLLAASFVLLLYLRGDLFYLFYLPTVLLFILGLLGVAASCSKAPAYAATMTKRGWPTNRALWLFPLGSFTLALMCMLALLFIPYRAGYPDLWPYLLDLPTPVVARLAVDVFGCMVLSTLVLFGVLTKAFIASRGYLDEHQSPSGRDVAASTVLVICAGGLLVLLLRWKLAMPDNVLFSRALYSLTVSAQPREALGLFNRILLEFPESELIDSTLFRAGRIYEEDLAERVSARELYGRVLQEHPDSPWCDDAAFRRACLAVPIDGTLSSAGHQELESFLSRFPHSCYADDALIEAIQRLLAAGNIERARILLQTLERDFPRAVYFSTQPGHYPRQIRSSLQRGQALLDSAIAEKRGTR